MKDHLVEQAVVIGGGPVGALQACYLSKRGYKVDLYESREDIRKADNASGRSINLALSCRGIEALKRVGLDKEITSLGIPMYGRMIHLASGKLYPVSYGRNDQHLLSVNRLKLNEELLTAASVQKNVTIHFKHKLISCNVQKPSAVFRREDGSEVDVGGDILFGCDGAYSAVRRQLQRGVFDYSQDYIRHGYKELTILPTSSGDAAMAKKYLHIWPRHEYMLIALPNLDNSFTCTLFMPFSNFDVLATGEQVVQFFKDTFPDALPLIGEEALKKDFFALPPLSLVSVKCWPYHYDSTVVIMGDAAHAVVPFYGQGLNAALEDVLVFDDVMEKFGGDFSKVLPEYSSTRCKDGHAISDLAKQNYIEMRSDVTSTWFLFRKKIDNLLHFFLPNIFIPKYSMVSFHRIPYHEVVSRSRKQDKVINSILALLALGGATYLLYSFRKCRHLLMELPVTFHYLVDKIELLK